MRAIAERLGAYAERLEGAWSVEIGPAGPNLAMTRPPKRHEGTIRRIRDQLNAQLPTTHPGHICADGPEIEHPGLGRMRLPDAVVIPEDVLDEEGLAVDATQVLAVFIYGDKVPFGPWTVESTGFRRYGRAGDGVS